MFTRNPFQKVLSAYVDKIFPFSLIPISHRIYIADHSDFNLNEPPFQVLNISFSRTLQYASGMLTSRIEQVDSHFLPASYSCDVCHIHYDYIGKMETFNEDFRFIMSSLNESKVVKAMGDIDSNNEKNIITDVIYRTFRSTRKTYNCVFRDAIFRRIWKHFQIRGILSDNQVYPLDRSDKSCNIKRQQYLGMALDALLRSKNREKRRLQRDKYFLQAFKSVPLHILHSYRESVRRDCDLFGYDCSPADIFEGRKEGDEESNIFSDIRFLYHDEDLTHIDRNVVNK